MKSCFVHSISLWINPKNKSHQTWLVYKKGTPTIEKLVDVPLSGCMNSHPESISWQRIIPSGMADQGDFLPVGDYSMAAAIRAAREESSSGVIST